MSSIVEEIIQRGEAHPELAAYRSGDYLLNYGELVRSIKSLRLALPAPLPGEVCALMLPSGPEFLVALIAAAAKGYIVAPLDVITPERERAQFFSLLRPRCVIASADQCFGSVRHRFQNCAVFEPPESSIHHDAARCAPTGGFIRFTSGTTGAAKGVLISLSSAKERVYAAARVFELQPGERILCPLSMAHHFVVSLLQFLSHGCEIVRPTHNDPVSFVRCFEETPVHFVYATPFHIEQCVARAHSCPRELRLVMSTSVKLRRKSAVLFKEKFGIPVRESYGIIEVGIPIGDLEHDEVVSGSIGFALPGYEACVQTDNGRLDCGEGRLLVRGPGMFDAYLNPFQPLEHVLHDGWFCSGDVARIEPNGRIIVCGRASAAINVSGVKVFPEEVESVLLELPEIADCRVFGVHDLHLGEYIHAEILAAAPVDEAVIKRHCRSILGKVKTPSIISFVEAIEVTTTGKIKRIAS